MVSGLSELLESFAKRPQCYVFPVSFVTVKSYLTGLKAGLKLVGLDYSWDDYQSAASARGWDSRGNIGIERDFKFKGLSDEEMVREFIMVEVDAYLRALERAEKK